MDRRIPTVLSAGPPYERGLHLGRTVPDRIRHTLAAYMVLFRAQAGLRRSAVLARAEQFLPLIARHTPALLEEMRGIAAGAERDLREIIAINARTELLYGTAAQECTALGAVPPATSDGHIRIGQNWDWHPSLAGGLVLWVLQREEGPDVITLTEAGMVGKIGVNAAGVALCVNLLTSDADHPGPALPMHVILRQILDSAHSVDQAVSLIACSPRCTSCNHLVADYQGKLADIEATPAGYAVLAPSRGIMTHTNHCLDGQLRTLDRGAREKSETLARGARVQDLACATPLDGAGFRALLADHGTAPKSICRHMQTDEQSEERSESVASLIIDLSAGTLSLAEGPPCSNPYRTLQLADYLRRLAPV